MITLVEKSKRRFIKFRDNLVALKQSNITLRQIPYLIREWRLWLQITWNFKKIEGSWWKGIKTYSSIFEGVPQKKDREQEKRFPEYDN